MLIEWEITSYSQLIGKIIPLEEIIFIYTLPYKLVKSEKKYRNRSQYCSVQFYKQTSHYLMTV